MRIQEEYTQSTQPAGGFEPRTFLLPGDDANHHNTRHELTFYSIILPNLHLKLPY